VVQELIDIRNYILEGRYGDALLIIDELEGMSKQAIIRNIESFLVRLMIHLIKNQVEQRLTNSWAASISDSILQIKKLNLKNNRTSYYINSDEWEPFLEEAIEAAIRPASVELLNGSLNPSQVSDLLDRSRINSVAQNLLDLTYDYSVKDLLTAIDNYLAELPGGSDWLAE
jgi:hypothetical protein